MENKCETFFRMVRLGEKASVKISKKGAMIYVTKKEPLAYLSS